MIAFVSSFARFRELANCSFVLLAACWMTALCAGSRTGRTAPLFRRRQEAHLGLPIGIGCRCQSTSGGELGREGAQQAEGGRDKRVANLVQLDGDWQSGSIACGGQQSGQQLLGAVRQPALQEGPKRPPQHRIGRSPSVGCLFRPPNPALAGAARGAVYPRCPVACSY